MHDKIAISGTEFPFRPIEELFDMAAYLDVHNLELWIPHNFKFEELDKVHKELQQRELQAICISTWTQLNLPGDVSSRQHLIKQSIQAAKTLGASIVNTYFGANLSRNPEQSIEMYKKNILPCIQLAEENGIVIVLENEFDVTGVDITREAKWILTLVEEIDSHHFRLNYDPCNFYFANEESFPFAYNLLKNYIAYVHIKDGKKYHPNLYEYPGDDFFWRDKSGDYICTHLGEGALPYPGIIHQLEKDQYPGFLGFEPHVPVKYLKETFRQSIQYLKDNLNKDMKGDR